MTRRRRPLAALVVAALVAVLLPPPAAAAAAGAMSGTVVGVGGVPLSGVQVSAEGEGAPWGYGSAVTAADGTFAISGLPAGAYVVRFRPSGTNPEGYLREWYDDAHNYADVTIVNVSAGATRTGIDATLERGGQIAGIVTGPGGDPVNGVSVRLFRSVDEPWDWFEARTDHVGAYRVRGLPPGAYVVAFLPGSATRLAGEFHPDTVVVASAAAVPITYGAEVVGIDASLVLGGSISGVVTGPGGVPIVDAYVAIEPDDSAPVLDEASTTTDHTGAYTLTGLTAGEHVVRFGDWSSDGLVQEYFDDAYVEAAATPIPVPAGGAVTGIDAELGLVGAVKGTLTDARGDPVDDALVTVSDPVTGWSRYVQTAPDGSWSLEWVPPGDFAVYFQPSYRSGLVPEFAHDRDDLRDADLVTVGGPAVVVDESLADCDAPDAFSDVALDSVFCAPIHWLVAAGVTSGYPDGTFRPTGTVTRQAMAAFLHRTAGAPAGPYPDPGFSDVPPGHPFLHEISWLVATGIGSGYADGSFRPTAIVSRQATAAFLYRLAGSPPGPFDELWFDDVTMAHPFYDEIAWITEENIASGYGDGGFHPAGPISRQAMAWFLQRFRQRGLGPP